MWSEMLFQQKILSTDAVSSKRKWSGNLQLLRKANGSWKKKEAYENSETKSLKHMLRCINAMLQDKDMCAVVQKLDALDG